MSGPSRDGGSAFPRPYVSTGMSLRDYFAARAMAALLAGNASPHVSMQALADISYKYADAMLSRRAEP